MKRYDQSVEINHNPNWSYTSDHPYRILIILSIAGLGSGKFNVLLNLIKRQQPDIDKIYLYVKDTFEPKYQLLINGIEKVGIETLKNPKALIDYSWAIDDVYENLEAYNPTKKRRVLIVFDDMMTVMESNKKLSLIVTELFLRGRKLNISLVFIAHRISKCLKL